MESSILFLTIQLLCKKEEEAIFQLLTGGHIFPLFPCFECKYVLIALVYEEFK